jgi:type II secretory pathway pseudopilin PulG
MRFAASKWLVLAVASAAPAFVEARDVITEQHNVAVAQRILEKAQSAYDQDAERVRLLKERLAQQQGQLADAEKKADASRRDLAKAREEYDREQKILDQAWKAR